MYKDGTYPDWIDSDKLDSISIDHFELIKVDDPEDCSSYPEDHYNYYVHTTDGKIYYINFAGWANTPVLGTINVKLKKYIYDLEKDNVEYELHLDNSRILRNPTIRRI